MSSELRDSLMTSRLILAFLVGACRKSTLHRYCPRSASRRSSIHSSGAGRARSSKRARAPRLAPSFQWRPMGMPLPRTS